MGKYDMSHMLVIDLCWAILRVGDFTLSATPPEISVSTIRACPIFRVLYLVIGRVRVYGRIHRVYDTS